MLVMNYTCGKLIIYKGLNKIPINVFEYFQNLLDAYYV